MFSAHFAFQAKISFSRGLAAFLPELLFAAETSYCIGLHHIGFGGTEPDLSSSTKQIYQQ